jgi:glycosyltransferase involved in cell wall biosynthesis
MKILHILPYFASIYGGPVQAVRDIARMQAECGIDVEIATTTADGRGELAAETCVRLGAGTVPVRFFERSFPRGWFRSAPMHDWLKRCVSGFNGVHLHVPFTYPMHCAVRVARHTGVPYAITPHGVLDPWSLAHKRWKKAPYLALIERAHLTGARLIHVTSTLEAQGLRQLGMVDKVRRIPLAATVPLLMARNAGPRPGLHLLFLSRLHPIKDLRTLLYACARLNRPEIRLTVAGEGDPRYTASLRETVRELGLSAAVEFTGHLDDPAKQQAWQAHDVFVLPSLHENFSLATIEAMAAGMPVIVTDQVGVADRIAATGAGRVVPCGDPDALAAAIVEMLDGSVRGRAGEQARQLVEREFSSDVLRASYAEFAAELCGRG